MVDSVKNYGLAGVAANVELGKQGAQIIGSDSGEIAFLDKDGGAENISIAEGTDATHGVTKSQFDETVLPKYSYLKTSVNYNSGNVTLGNVSANTTIHSVVIEKGAGNWTDADSTTNITVGDDNDVDRLFASFDPTVQTVDETNYVYSSQETLKAYVTQGGASAGTASVTVWYSGTIE
jgi:hypothetical protein